MLEERFDSELHALETEKRNISYFFDSMNRTLDDWDDKVEIKLDHSKFVHSKLDFRDIQ